MLRRIICQMVKVARCPLTMSSRLISTYPHLGKEFEGTQFPISIETGINHVTLMGRVGSDLKSLENELGTHGVFIMGVNVRTGNRAVGYKKETLWYRIVANKERELKIMNRTGKGDRAFVQGSILPINPKYVKENLAPLVTVAADRIIIVQKKLEKSEEQQHSEEEEMDQW